MDNDDPKHLAKLANRWTWAFGGLALADILGPLLFWARLDVNPNPPLPRIVAGLLYIGLVGATLLAYTTRLRLQLECRVAEMAYRMLVAAGAHQIELAGVRADLADLAEQIAGYEENRDRRDGLLYRNLSALRTNQGQIGRAVVTLAEREPVTEQIAAVAGEYASREQVAEVHDITTRLSRHLSSQDG